MREATSLLPEQARRIFQLSRETGLKAAEVGEQLGISGSNSTQLTRALRKIYKGIPGATRHSDTRTAYFNNYLSFFLKPIGMFSFPLYNINREVCRAYHGRRSVAHLATCFEFLPLLESFKKYNWVFDYHKYKNNYDYQLAIMIINRIYYMTNGSVLLHENQSLFSPISKLHYEFYSDRKEVEKFVEGHTDIQCVVGKNYVPFGQAQKPALSDYADKADTLKFLRDL